MAFKAGLGLQTSWKRIGLKLGKWLLNITGPKCNTEMVKLWVLVSQIMNASLLSTWLKAFSSLPSSNQVLSQRSTNSFLENAITPSKDTHTHTHYFDVSQQQPSVASTTPVPSWHFDNNWGAATKQRFSSKLSKPSRSLIASLHLWVLKDNWLIIVIHIVTVIHKKSSQQRHDVIWGYFENRNNFEMCYLLLKFTPT